MIVRFYIQLYCSVNQTYLCVHASIAEIIVVDPFLAGFAANGDIVAIDVIQSGARGILELSVDLTDLLICHIHKLIMIAPVIWHKTNDSLRKVMLKFQEIQ